MAGKKHLEPSMDSRQQRRQEHLNDVDNGKRTVKALVKTHPKEESLKSEANGSRNIPQA
jgi:hypothetical protein